MKQLQLLKVTLCLMPTLPLALALAQHGQKSMPFSVHYKSKNPKFTFTTKYHINLCWQIILLIGLSSSYELNNSRNFVHHLCFSVSLVFPKIQTSLNVNHPVGIHVTNARGFPCMCGLRLCHGSDLSLARKK